MSYVVWDIETDSAQTDWATIIELGAILLDDNFKEKERVDIIYVDQFNEDLWKGYTIIEPTKQMKEYKKIN